MRFTASLRGLPVARPVAQNPLAVARHNSIGRDARLAGRETSSLGAGAL